MIKWILILLVGLVSLSWVLMIPNEPTSDQMIYHRTASDLAAGLGYVDDSGSPWAYWAPGYSFYLAFFYKIFGSAPFVGFCANWLAYLALVAGVFFVGRDFYSPNAGWIAGCVAGLYPSLILYNTTLASETLFSALTIWGLFCLCRSFKEENKFWWGITAGLLFGLATLIRSQGLILPFIALVAGPVYRLSVLRSLSHLFLVGSITMLVCLPWGLRNQQQFGTFILVSANSGANLWMGNHPGATGGYTDLGPYLEQEGIAHLPLPARDAYMKQKAVDFIKENPLEFLKLIGKRTWITMKRESIPVVWNKIGIQTRFGEQAVFYFKLFNNAVYVLLLLTFAYALVRRNFHREDLILAAMILFLSLPFLLFIGQNRYHLVLIPYVILLIVGRLRKPLV